MAWPQALIDFNYRGFEGIQMRMFVREALAALVICGSMNSQAQQAVPQSLQDWQGWVLRGRMLEPDLSYPDRG